MENKIKAILSSILEIEITEIQNDLSSDSVENWDSLRHIMLVLKLEDEFSVKFDENEIQKLLSFKTISEVVSRKYVV